MAITSLRRTILLDLSEIVPEAAQRLLFIPPVPPEAVDSIASREGSQAVVAMPDSQDAQAAAPFDAIFLYEPELAPRLVATCASMLGPHGFLVVPLPMERPETGPLKDGIKTCMDQAGLAIYSAFENSLSAEAGYRFTSGGRIFERICIYTHKTYDPFVHADLVAEAGRPDWAFSVMDMVPLDPKYKPEEIASLVAHRQKYLEAQFDAAEPAARLALLWEAQDRVHYLNRNVLPHLPGLYTRQAQMWGKIGLPDHARKLLRDVHIALPEKPLSEAAIEAFHHPASPESAPVGTPEWPPRPMSVLMITPLFPNYGLDVLYDGLCEVLGDEHVDDYPWKPWLHGQNPDAAQNYPCTCQRRGQALENRDLILRLVEGYYDCVLIPDVETSVQFLHPDLVRIVLKAAKNTPVFMVDQADDFKDHRTWLKKELQFNKLRGYLKREMLEGFDYGADAYPCPFAYADSRVPSLGEEERTEDVFWAGNRSALRAPYVEQIEQMLGRSFDRMYDQVQYRQALLSSRIGISLAGAGFDTVRYWELPAHGCMLLSERIPTVIPHNFEDGVSAVFANDAADMVEKLRHYISHPDEAAEIALAGHQHLRKYHTGSARARQLLGYISKNL